VRNDGLPSDSARVHLLFVEEIRKINEGLYFAGGVEADWFSRQSRDSRIVNDKATGYLVGLQMISLASLEELKDDRKFAELGARSKEFCSILSEEGEREKVRVMNELREIGILAGGSKNQNFMYLLRRGYLAYAKTFPLFGSQFFSDAQTELSGRHEYERRGLRQWRWCFFHG